MRGQPFFHPLFHVQSSLVDGKKRHQSDSQGLLKLVINLQKKIFREVIRLSEWRLSGYQRVRNALQTQVKLEVMPIDRLHHSVCRPLHLVPAAILGSPHK
jgi:hypothetical protein